MRFKKLLSTLFTLFTVWSIGQCPLGVSFGSGSAPAPGNNVDITTCAYAGEYQQVDNVVAGDDYVLTYTGGAGNYITLFDATFTPVAQGYSPLSWTATASGTFYSQANVDDISCGTDATCHTANWANTSPPPPCPAEVAPWSDDLETLTPSTNFTGENCWTATSLDAYDWNIDGAGSTPSSNTGPLGANSGTNYFYVEASSGTSGVSTATLTTPQIDVSALTVPQLNYFYHMTGGQIGTLTVEAWDGAAWNQIDQIVGAQQSAQGDPWALQIVSLAGYTGVIQLRFIAVSAGTFEGDISLDDISVVEAPTCPFPTLLSATNIAGTTADLSWQENGSATVWNLEYGAPGFALGTGTAVTGTTNNPETITGLTPLTDYEFYVQADCGGGDLSTWVGPFSFTTACAAIPAPWTDDLESLTPSTTFVSQGCWNASSVSAYDWNVDGVGSTPSSNTGPLGANSGANYLYVEASSGSAGNIATLLSPQIDVTALTLPMIEFYYHMFGGQMGNLYVDAWDGAAWNQVDVISGAQQTAQADPWLRRAIYLPGYTGITQIRFRAESQGTFEGDISLDDISILEAPSCPEPSNFSITGSDLTSADFAWSPIGSELEWQLEYGAPGFTPDVQAGTSILTGNNPETLSGLTPNTFYEIYLQAVCSPGDTSLLVGPIAFNTFDVGLYMDWDTECPSGGWIDIEATGNPLNLTDDGEIGVTIPFTFLYQGVPINEVSIGNNGDIKLGTLTGTTSFSGNMTTLANGLYPWLDDLDSETGNVYEETIGTSPNRVFVVQWQERCNFPGSIGAPNVTFQVQIEEATSEIYFVYEDAVFGGTNSNDDYGANADIGVAGPSQDINVSNNDPTYLTNNTCAHFFYVDCPNPINYSVIYTTNDEAGISWSAGLANETDWTVIYGVQGFDPTSAGTTISTPVPSVIIPGLDDITTYDVYIYADCDPGVLQSSGFVGQFTTLPNCSDPTAITTATAVDSVFSSWSWVESSGVGTYPSSGFNIQYGNGGFDLYTGTVVNADNNFTDTTFDASFLGGGVYDLYVQAVCGADTSNFVGPVSFTMPLTNDSTCLAENLAVDGTVYLFDNTGATVQTGEAAIAPPATGFQTTDGWGNTSVNFTTWFTFTAPASGNVLISGVDQGFDGQVAVYETTDCSDLSTYTLLGANDDAVNGGSAAPEFIICGLTPGNTYYLMHDSWSTVTTGVYSLSLDEIDVNAGSSNGIIDVCTGASVDLFNGITGNDAGGVWTEWIPTAGFSGSTFNSAGLAYQVFNFAYTVEQGCAIDSVQQQVQIYGPSSAGNDGVLDVCLNQPFDLVSGLSGNVDLGGTWYDPANNALASSALTAPNIAGQFNYDYITSNGVCPEDTSNVVVNVNPGCDWLDIEELYFSGIEVYPNPTTENIFISNLGAEEVFSYELTDAQGKVIVSKANAINGTKITEINVKSLEIGIYLIRIYNENATKTFRVVKQ